MPNPTLQSLPVLGSIDDWLRQRKFNKQFQQWQAKGKPAPSPHLAKQRNIIKHARQYGTRVMVETGTFHGDMCHAMRDVFDRIYTIELSDALYEGAVKRFRRVPHIQPMHGDSGQVIAEVLAKIEEPALFWLDGHYSSGNTAQGELDTPISQELDHILAHRVRDHVILIDDARCFTGENDYPQLESLRAYLLEQRPDWAFHVENDCICFTPPPADPPA